MNSLSVASTELVTVRTLDSVLAEMGAEVAPIYLKLDVQGAELDALHGAAASLRRTDAVEVELTLSKLYEGQCLLPDVWQYLTDSGLRPAWLERGFKRPDDIWLLQVDALFVREEAWRRSAAVDSSECT